jgi:hypothetical protein
MSVLVTISSGSPLAGLARRIAPAFVPHAQFRSLARVVCVCVVRASAAHMVEAFLDKTPENSHARLDETTVGP